MLMLLWELAALWHCFICMLGNLYVVVNEESIFAMA